MQYLNARPLIDGFAGDIHFDHPAKLCAQLASGELDVALVSSFEYLRNPVYAIVDGVSISSERDVYSVILAHRLPLTEVKRCALDPASLTSVALLRVLLAAQNFKPEIVSADDRSLDENDAGRLLIGDQAIRFRDEQGARFQYYDLASAWRQLTGLPFVFALWLVRPEVQDARELADALRRQRDLNLTRLDEIAGAQKQVPVAFCKKYFREHLSYALDDSHKAGLAEFHRRAAASGLDVAPALDFRFV